MKIDWLSHSHSPVVAFFALFVLMVSPALAVNSEDEEGEPVVYLEQTNETSQRTAVVEDNGDAVWAYLTQPGSPDLSSRVFLFNRNPPTAEEEASEEFNFDGSPAPPNFLSQNGLLENPEATKFSVAWSPDGQGFVISYKGNPTAFLLSPVEGGFSRTITREGFDVVHPWDEGVYQKVFVEHRPIAEVAQGLIKTDPAPAEDATQVQTMPTVDQTPNSELPPAIPR